MLQPLDRLTHAVPADPSIDPYRAAKTDRKITEWRARTDRSATQAKEKISLNIIPLLVAILAIAAVSIFGLSVFFPVAAHSAVLVTPSAAVAEIKKSDSAPIIKVTPIVTATPIEVASIALPAPTPENANLPALDIPDDLKINGCLTRMARILQGEAEVISDTSAYRFVASEILYTARLTKCASSGNSYLESVWYGNRNVTQTESVKQVFVDAVQWSIADGGKTYPPCLYVGTWNDLIGRWLPSALRLDNDLSHLKDNLKVSYTFSSPDHLWTEIGVNCNPTLK